MTSPSANGAAFESANANGFLVMMGDLSKCTVCPAQCDVQPCDVKNYVMLRNFFAAMNIFETVEELNEATHNLPFSFCKDCRDHMQQLSDKYAQYVKAKEEFEMARDCLAICTINSATATTPNDSGTEGMNRSGIQEKVRKFICERWGTLVEGATVDQEGA